MTGTAGLRPPPAGVPGVSVPRADVNGIQIYYEPAGSGAPLVILGGLGLDVSEMGVLTGPLSQRFRVVAVGNRGTGRSAKPPGPYSIEQMAADVVGLLGRLGLARVHVLGLSMGGRIAMAMALACPERVDRLVPVATGPRAAGARWLVRAGMAVADLPVLRGRHGQPRYAMKAQFDATTRFDCTSRLGELRGPALILAGKSDRIAPAALAGEMHASIPGSHLVLLDGGHLAPLTTRHERVIAEVSAFLAPGDPGRLV
jgi:3-oxoadipate enol-lactonase